MFSSTATADEIWEKLVDDGVELSAAVEGGQFVVTVAGTGMSASRPLLERREALVEVAKDLGYEFSGVCGRMKIDSRAASLAARMRPELVV